MFRSFKEITSPAFGILIALIGVYCAFSFERLTLPEQSRDMVRTSSFVMVGAGALTFLRGRNNWSYWEYHGIVPIIQLILGFTILVMNGMALLIPSIFENLVASPETVVIQVIITSFILGSALFFPSLRLQKRKPVR